MKFSIIIAAYNAEAFIEKCINSAQRQTYKNIEIICVDDGSKDNTFDLAATLSNKDSRIKVLRHDRNEGILISRLDGIEVATGDYILFLDADDELTTDCCSVLSKSIKKYDTDILSFGIELRVNSEKVPIEYIPVLAEHFSPLVESLTMEDIERKCFVENKYSHNVWGKVYKASICHQLAGRKKRERIIVAEDYYMYFVFASFAKTYIGISNKLYIYNYGQGVTGFEKFSLEAFSSYCTGTTALKITEELMKEMGCYQEHKDSLFKQYMYLVQLGLNKIEMVDEESREIYFKVLFSNFKLEDVLIASAVKYWNCAEKISEYINFTENHKNVPEKIKTIGLFYHRLYNGGVERVLAAQAKYFSDSGYRVVLLTDEPCNKLDFSLDSSVTRIVLPAVTQDHQDSVINRLTKLKQTVEDNEIDFFIYHAWMSTALFWDLCIVKSCNVPFTIQAHGVFSCVPIKDLRRMCNLYRHADAVITLSAVDRFFWQIFCTRSYLTQNPLTELDKSYGRASLESKNILWIGRLSYEKRPLTALKIFKKVIEKEKDVRLLMVGDGDDIQLKEDIKRTIKELEIEKNVELLGYRKDISKLFSEASIYLQTSDFEGFSLSITESMAFGVPAVIFELPHIEYIRNSKSITSVKWNDIDESAEKICEMLGDINLRKELGEQAEREYAKLAEYAPFEVWNDVFSDVLHNRKTELRPSGDEINMLVYCLEQHKKRNPIFLCDPFDLIISNVLKQNVRDDYEVLSDNMTWEVTKALNEMAWKIKETRLSTEGTINNLRNNVDAIYHSYRYRVGSVLLFIPALIKNLFTKLRKTTLR